MPQRKTPIVGNDDWGLFARAGHLVSPRGWGGGVDGDGKTYVIRFA